MCVCVYACAGGGGHLQRQLLSPALPGSQRSRAWLPTSHSQRVGPRAPPPRRPSPSFSIPVALALPWPPVTSEHCPHRPPGPVWEDPPGKPLVCPALAHCASRHPASGAPDRLQSEHEVRGSGRPSVHCSASRPHTSVPKAARRPAGRERAAAGLRPPARGAALTKKWYGPWAGSKMLTTCSWTPRGAEGVPGWRARGAAEVPAAGISARRHSCRRRQGRRLPPARAP